MGRCGIRHPMGVVLFNHLIQCAAAKSASCNSNACRPRSRQSHTRARCPDAPGARQFRLATESLLVFGIGAIRSKFFECDFPVNDAVVCQPDVPDAAGRVQRLAPDAILLDASEDLGRCWLNSGRRCRPGDGAPNVVVFQSRKQAFDLIASSRQRRPDIVAMFLQFSGDQILNMLAIFVVKDTHFDQNVGDRC